jgi:ERF superfamily protein
MEQTKPSQPVGILKRLLSVRQEIGAIEKNKKMDMGGGRGYTYRGIEDLYLAVQELLNKHGVVTVTTVQPGTMNFSSFESTTKGGFTKLNTRCTAVVNVTFFDPEDGSSVTASGLAEGVDDSDKAAGKATSYGMKNVYFHTFVVPTQDPDDERPDTTQAKKTKKASEASAPANSNSDRVSHDEFKDARWVTELELATSLGELKDTWDRIPSDQRTADVIKAKETRKNDLQKKVA